MVTRPRRRAQTPVPPGLRQLIFGLSKHSPLSLLVFLNLNGNRNYLQDQYPQMAGCRRANARSLLRKRPRKEVGRCRVGRQPRMPSEEAVDLVRDDEFLERDVRSSSRRARSTVWWKWTLRSSSPWISRTGDLQPRWRRSGEEFEGDLHGLLAIALFDSAWAAFRPGPRATPTSRARRAGRRRP